MKKLLLLSLVILASVPCFSQQLQKLKSGSILTYGVKAQGKEYEFIVTLKDFQPSTAIEFDWKMTEPVNRNGSIRIPGLPLLGSYAWYNFFSGGALTLYEETSVFISETLKNELKLAKKGDAVSKPIQLNGISKEGEKFNVVNKEDAHFYRVNGEMITAQNCIKIANADNSKWVVISTEPTFAVILNMSIGFEISLKSIQY
jgi:hypothetical protein